MRIQILFFIILYTTTSLAYTMSSYIDTHPDLNSFKYGKYLSKVSFSNVDKLAQDKKVADTKGLGDDFLYNLADYFIRKHPFKIDDIENTISIGENFLHFKSKNGLRKDGIYKIIGYYILSKCATIIEEDVNKRSSSWFYFLKDKTRIR